MKNILVITDLTEAATNLLRFANKLALKADADILLLHCTHTAALTPTAENKALNQLRSFASRLQSGYPHVNATVIHHECVVRSGSLVSSVVDLVQDYKIDLIVTAAANPETEITQEIPALMAALPQNVNCPILLVPAQFELKQLARICYAADFTKLDMGMLKRMTAFASLFYANLDLVHVYNRAQRYSLVQVKKALDQLCTEVVYVKTSFFLLEEDDNLEGINEFAQLHDADLLVIATPDANLINCLSSSEYIKTDAFHRHIPVMVYPERDGGICSANCPVCTPHKQRKPNLELVAI